jgi:aminoglycoside/choline kinase family phosphotransferase
VTDLTLPATAADIDRDWIAAALVAGGLRAGAGIDAVEVGPLDSAAVGLIGDVLQCRIRWAQGAADDTAGDTLDLPRSVVIKLPSSNEGNRALALAMGYYDVEHHFYLELAPASGIRTPRCWYSAGDADAGLYSLLIEDLGHLEFVDQAEGLDADRAELALRRAAALHGRNWLANELVGLPWLPDGYGDAIRVYGALISDSWPSWREAVDGVLSPADLELARRFVDGYDAIVDASAADPWTLAHRDYRVDNMAFDGDDVIVMDWGSAARGYALYDVAYFLGGSLDTEVRRSAHDRLLRAYRDALADAGGEPFDDDRFAQALRVAALYCLIVPIMAGGNALDAKDERGAELVSIMLKRTFELLHDLDAAAELPA